VEKAIMILVLGATGTIGGEVARQLIEGGHKPRLLVRDPAKARAFAAGAEIVQGDLKDTRSLDSALRGVDKFFLLSATHGGVDVELEASAIKAARKAGVKHVVKLSVVAAEAPIDTFGKQHAQSERLLRDSGLAWTMLRPHFFMSNTLRWAETIRSQGVVYYPTAEGRWPAVDPRDIGAVAVKALTEPGHVSKAYTLSGPESLSATQYVEKLSAALGKQVRLVNVPLEAVRDGLLKSGMPAVHADPLMELLAAMKAGKLDKVADDFYRVMGRKPGTFDEWTSRNSDAFG
jgi:(4-alkanoyl-5-oxo-2,5-dihydrofuran-3-yl)methyl phosphate reductase